MVRGPRPQRSCSYPGSQVQDSPRPSINKRPAPGWAGPLTPCVQQGVPRHCLGCGCKEDLEDWQKGGCISQEVCSQTSDRDRCRSPARMGLESASRSLLSKNSSSSGATTAQSTATTNVTHTHTHTRQVPCVENLFFESSQQPQEISFSIFP